jgi:hypothetical protein
MRLELAQAKAERIIRDELERLGWQAAGSASHGKRDSDKPGAAARLRKETTLSVKQIAARLHLGTPGGASVCLLAAMTKRTSSTQPPSTQGHLET